MASEVLVIKEQYLVEFCAFLRAALDQDEDMSPKLKDYLLNWLEREEAYTKDWKNDE